MEERLYALIAEVLKMPVAEVKDELSMDSTEVWDSLRHMDLIVSIEQAFHLELTFEEITAMRDVGQIKQVLRARGLGA